MIAKGRFEVKLQPLDTYMEKEEEGMNMARMSINKTYQGDLQATSQGEMLSLVTFTNGSAGYVAMEKVTGSLEGKQGSFALQHFGVMKQGENRLLLEVIPDSATGELVGLWGGMSITIEDGEHYYEFDYSFNQ